MTYSKNRLLKAVFDLDLLKVDTVKPFRLTSDRYSPIYIDARLWTQSPAVADLVIKAMEKEIEEVKYDVLAGGVTGGVPYAERLAHQLKNPSIYVRDEPKGHGKNAQIEGIEDLGGKKVLLVEDMITDDGSKIDFIEGLEKAGGKIDDCLVFIDREQGGRETLEEKDVNLKSILTLSQLVKYGERENKISKENLKTLQEYLKDPEAWQRNFTPDNPDYRS